MTQQTDFQRALHSLLEKHVDLTKRPDDPPPPVVGISHTEEQLIALADRAHGAQISTPDIPLEEITTVISWILKLTGVLK